MSTADWIVTLVTLCGIVLYGMWKSRRTRTLDTFLLADRQLPWYHVALSVMATQASAITFLSAPGQAYSDGLRFIQFYFGLPLAMIALCAFFIPVYRKLNVYTAYEYLETRFDGRTRMLTAGLFLLQRGLSTGITIYAPAIVLSHILSLNIIATIIMVGLSVMIYTFYGGTKAVSYTQVLQMIIIFSGLIVAGLLVIHYLPGDVTLTDALHVAGKMGRMNAIDTSFDVNNRYNVWSGIIGGFFLQLSYFGTDQSQVGRYLTGSSVRQSRIGLIMNGLIKIPMQFIVLMIGVLVFAYYQFNAPPVYFNATELKGLHSSVKGDSLALLEKKHAEQVAEQARHVRSLVDAMHRDNEPEIERAASMLKADRQRSDSTRKTVMRLARENNPAADKDDSNYIFLSFVTTKMPTGMIGLLIAVIFLAAMGSMASGLNSLASSAIVDFYKRYRPDETEGRYLRASRLATAGWGLFCIVTAIFASRLGNLIEAVNILGSLFYGTILGIFCVALFIKHVGAKAVFIAAVFTELLVCTAWALDLVAFLWLNVGGCLMVCVIAVGLQGVMSGGRRGMREREGN